MGNLLCGLCIMFWCCCPSAGGTCGSGSVVETFDNGMPDPLYRCEWYSPLIFYPGLDASWTTNRDALWSTTTVAGAGSIDGRLNLKNGQGWLDYHYPTPDNPSVGGYEWGRTSILQCFDRQSLTEQLLSVGSGGGEIDYTELMELYVYGIVSERDLYDLPAAGSSLHLGIYRALEVRIVDAFLTYQGNYSRDWYLQWGVDNRFNSGTTIIWPVDPESVNSKLSVKIHYYNVWPGFDEFKTADANIQVRVNDVLVVDDEWFFVLGGPGRAFNYPYAWADAYTVPIQYDSGARNRRERYDAETDLHDTTSRWILDDWTFYNTPA